MIYHCSKFVGQFYPRKEDVLILSDSTFWQTCRKIHKHPSSCDNWPCFLHRIGSIVSVSAIPTLMDLPWTAAKLPGELVANWWKIHHFQTRSRTLHMVFSAFH